VSVGPGTSEHTYLVTCLYGLEGELAAEVGERFGVPTERRWCEVVCRLEGSPAQLKTLRLAGNVFLRFARFRVGHTRDALHAIAERVRGIPLDSWFTAAEEFAGDGIRDEPVSVHVTRQGKHNYTYAEVEEAVMSALEGERRCRATLGESPLELRVEVKDDACRLLGRLSAVPVSRRPYKVRRVPAETDATIAAAMIRRSQPGRGDRVLDPYCGSGTIPIERALAGPAACIVAGDNKAKLVGWTAANAEAAGVDVSLGVWDAMNLPFADRAFTRVVTAPPLGNPQTGRQWSLTEFGRLLAELLRVLEFGCPMVVLVRDEKLTTRALKRVGHARITGGLRCDWKGRRHTIFTVERTA